LDRDQEVLVKRDDELTDGLFQIDATQAKVTLASAAISAPWPGTRPVGEAEIGTVNCRPPLEFHAVKPHNDITEQFQFFWLLRLGSGN